MAQQGNTGQKRDLELINTKRNPYLADYNENRKSKEQRKNAAGVGRSRNHGDTQAGTRMRGSLGARRRMTAKRRARIRRQKRMMVLAAAVCAFVFLTTGLIRLFDKPDVDGSVMPQQVEAVADLSLDRVQGLSAADYATHPKWTEDFLTPSEYTRPEESLKEVTNIFVHYTANKGTSAAQNRSYFEQLKDTHERSASAHFIIGYEGEIIQCIPLDEVAYAVQTRNEDSISIECCYLADDGSFTQETYDSLITLLQWLIETYDLEADDILRHYDCGGKKCPVYYTEHEDAWEQLKEDVKTL